MPTALRRILLLVPLTATAHAMEPQDIIEKAAQHQKVSNTIQQVKMVLVSKSGAERIREFELRIRRDPDAVRSYTRFQSPSDHGATNDKKWGKKRQNCRIFGFWRI